MSQMIVGTGLTHESWGGALTTSPPVFEKIGGGKVGRLWLREVQGGIWSKSRYAIIGAKDVYALAEEREGEIINLYVAG
jgi:hypothetical protein